jgi:hypothetical protein
MCIVWHADCFRQQVNRFRSSPQLASPDPFPARREMVLRSKKASTCLVDQEAEPNALLSKRQNGRWTIPPSSRTLSGFYPKSRHTPTLRCST